MLKYLEMAAKLAVPRQTLADRRSFWLAAVGIRADGVIVSAQNGSVFTDESFGNGWSFPAAHAEARVCRKLDHKGVIYVSRVSRKTGQLTMARPCPDCQQAMRSRRVKKVYYSISPTEYGVISLCGNERVVKRPTKSKE